ncbi:MAG TPA: hypothetical protein ENK66_07325, partial [Arcobacter sp.]|nr:hypothetical protein [Arcobacter sp.]
MFKKIKTKLLLWYIGITFIILVGFSYAIIQTFIYQNINTVDTKLLAIAYDIEHDLDKYLSGEGKYFDEEEEFFIQNLDIAIIKKDKDKYSIVLASKPNLLIRTSSEEFATYKMKNSIKRVLYYKAKYYKEFYIQIGTTLEDKINEPINNLKNDIFLLVPLIFILSLFAGYFVISKALRPVNQVIE